ncbi:MAG: hypothetical protein KDA69_06540 [Planctomycetaceae bacterium]|nr:hypothetical protein [Planctomycetaceae bacterium]
MTKSTICFAITMLGLLVQDEQAKAQGDWTQRALKFRSKYYEVQSDFDQEESQDLASHMDLTADAYIRLLGGLRPQRSVSLGLLLFQEQDDYQDVLTRHFSVPTQNSQGMMMARGNQMYLAGFQGRYGNQRMREVLQHEGFHQFSTILFPNIPSWADEGTAEVFARGVPFDGKLVVGQVDAEDLRRIHAILDADDFRHFADMFTIDADGWRQSLQTGSGQQGSVNYLQAWTMSHFFLFAEDKKYQKPFIKFLTLLNRNAEYPVAWVGAFGEPNFDIMEARWQEYVKNLWAEDYRETIRRMDFLSAGILFLNGQDVVPLTIEQLKSELRSHRFKHTRELFGKEVTFDVNDDELFTIPIQSEHDVTNPPVFELVDTRGKTIDATRPYKVRTPPGIATSGLQAENFLLKWNVKKGNTFEPTFGPR